MDETNVTLQELLDMTVNGIARMDMTSDAAKIACDNLKTLAEAQRNLSEAEAKLKDVEAKTRQAEESLRLEREKASREDSHAERTLEFEIDKEERRRAEADRAFEFENEKEAQRQKESKRDFDLENEKEANRAAEAEAALKEQRAHDLKMMGMGFGDGFIKTASVLVVPLSTYMAIKADKAGDFPCKLALGVIPKIKLPW